MNLKDLIREAYVARASQKSLAARPFDKLWERWTAESGAGILAGESLGELTEDEIRRWARVAALQANAEALSKEAAEAAERAMVELKFLYYEFSDRLGIIEDVPSAVDPITGTMRRVDAGATPQDPRATLANMRRRT